MLKVGLSKMTKEKQNVYELLGGDADFFVMEDAKINRLGFSLQIGSMIILMGFSEEGGLFIVPHNGDSKGKIQKIASNFLIEAYKKGKIKIYVHEENVNPDNFLESTSELSRKFMEFLSGMELQPITEDELEWLKSEEENNI